MGTDHVIIAHGRSEVVFFKALLTHFDIDANIHSRDNGKFSIVISHLPGILSEQPFRSEKELASRWTNLDYVSGRVPNLVIFPVVDYDGDNRNALPYITGNLLRNVPLAYAVRPVLNYPNMDSVMREMGFGELTGDKVEYYQKLANRIRGRKNTMSFYEKLCRCEHTNMDELMYHFLKRHPDYQSMIDPPARKDWSCLSAR